MSRERRKEGKKLREQKYVDTEGKKNEQSMGI